MTVVTVPYALFHSLNACCPEKQNLLSIRFERILIEMIWIGAAGAGIQPLEIRVARRSLYFDLSSDRHVHTP